MITKLRQRGITLSRTERIVTAYAQRAYGPGWANSPIWVVIEDTANGKHRNHCIQPKEQTAEMAHLYGVCAAAHASMVAAVTRVVRRKGGAK